MALVGLVPEVDWKARCGGAGTELKGLSFFLGEEGSMKLGLGGVRGLEMTPCLHDVDACLLVMAARWRGGLIGSSCGGGCGDGGLLDKCCQVSPHDVDAVVHPG